MHIVSFKKIVWKIVWWLANGRKTVKFEKYSTSVSKASSSNLVIGTENKAARCFDHFHVQRWGKNPSEWRQRWQFLQWHLHQESIMWYCCHRTSCFLSILWSSLFLKCASLVFLCFSLLILLCFMCHCSLHIIILQKLCDATGSGTFSICFQRDLQNIGSC